MGIMEKKLETTSCLCLRVCENILNVTGILDMI